MSGVVLVCEGAAREAGEGGGGQEQERAAEHVCEEGEDDPGPVHVREVMTCGRFALGVVHAVLAETADDCDPERVHTCALHAVKESRSGHVEVPELWGHLRTCML